jgi:hypothetical protein
MRLPHVEWTSAYIKARTRCFRPLSIESGFQKAGIYPFDPEILLLTLTPPPRTPSPENQVPSQMSDASRILRAKLGEVRVPLRLSIYVRLAISFKTTEIYQLQLETLFGICYRRLDRCQVQRARDGIASWLSYLARSLST